MDYGSLRYHVPKPTSTIMKRLIWLLVAATGAAALFAYTLDLSESTKSTSEIKAMQKAMVKFRNSLSPELLEKGSASLKDQRLYLWHNTPIPVRGDDYQAEGIMYGDLSTEQLRSFKDVLMMFLSKKGYQKVDAITVLAEGFLKEVRPKIWDPQFYSIDMFGDPSKDDSWGFQLDGHHCIINFLVHGENVSMVPAFLGAEPVKESFQGKEFDIFGTERDLALELYHSLSSDERQAAVSTGSMEALTLGAGNPAGSPDPYRGDYDYSGFKKGLKHADMSKRSAEILEKLMLEHVNNLSSTFAKQWFRDISKNLSETYFVWIDQVDQPDNKSQFYYRIYNPYLWVEFNITNPIFKELDDWNHVHSITRIPNNSENGGDYGIFADLVNQNGIKMLYQHYASSDHHRLESMKLDYELDYPLLQEALKH